LQGVLCPFESEAVLILQSRAIKLHIQRGYVDHHISWAGFPKPL